MPLMPGVRRRCVLWDVCGWGGGIGTENVYTEFKGYWMEWNIRNSLAITRYFVVRICPKWNVMCNKVALIRTLFFIITDNEK